MDADPIRRDARRARRERLLSVEAECLICGVRSPEALVRLHKPLLDEHHVAGWRNDPDLVVTLCQNCHAIVEEANNAAGVELFVPREPSDLRRLVSFLAAVAEFLRLLADSVEAFAERMRQLLAFLNEQHPDWRSRLRDWEGGAE